ncbi:MAG TPA: hypothetical protein VK072_01005 [Candidatus Avamphibacillus sp.]|nr:hypothetical protein [Candidatus Avamphibacillus sp.]
MKKTFYIALGIVMVLLLSGCFNKEGKADELVKYHNSDWATYSAKKEKSVSPKIKSFIVLAAEDDREGIEALINESLLPSINELVNYLEEIQLEHKEIQELNHLQIEIVKDGYKRFQEIGEVLNSGDGEELKQVLEKFGEYGEELDNMYEEFYDERGKLMKKYDVHWDDEYVGDEVHIKKMKK